MMLQDRGDTDRMHHNQNQVTAIPIFMEEYLRNEAWKCNQQHSDDKLRELVDIFSKHYVTKWKWRNKSKS